MRKKITAEKVEAYKAIDGFLFTTEKEAVMYSIIKIQTRIKDYARDISSLSMQPPQCTEKNQASALHRLYLKKYQDLLQSLSLHIADFDTASKELEDIEAREGREG